MARFCSGRGDAGDHPLSKIIFSCCITISRIAFIGRLDTWYNNTLFEVDMLPHPTTNNDNDNSFS